MKTEFLKTDSAINVHSFIHSFFPMLALFLVFQCCPSTSFAQFFGFVHFEGTTTGMGGVSVFLDPADPNTNPCDETTNFLGGFACSNFISAGSIKADVTIPGSGQGGILPSLIGWTVSLLLTLF